MRVPECEILIATHAVKNFIRTRDFFKIASALETGAEHGMWSLHRYRTWLDNRSKWHTADNPVKRPIPSRPTWPFRRRRRYRLRPPASNRKPGRNPGRIEYLHPRAFRA